MNPFRLTPFEQRVKAVMDLPSNVEMTSREIADILNANETLVSKAMGSVDRWRKASLGEIGTCRACRRLIRFVELSERKNGWNGEWHHVNGRDYNHTATPKL